MAVTNGHAFGIWSAEDRAPRIEYSIAVLEEICADAVDGLYRFRHGGIEIGGVLFGEVDADVVRILAYRPLACEHAFGPRFVLSDRDRANLKDLLYAGQQDSELRELEPVGWYHSHTRSDIELSPRDLEIYESYFPRRWQIALVIRPDHYGPAQAGFFLRERDNVIHTASSYSEFQVQSRRHGLSRAAEPEADITDNGAEEAVEEAGSVPAVAEVETQSPRPETETEQILEPEAVEAGTPAVSCEEPQIPSFARIEPPRRRKWPWLLVIAALLAAAAFGGFAYYRLSAPQPLSLWVADMGGQLLIEWDRTARPIRDAQSATLEINDANHRIEIQIDRDRLREGSVDYVRQSEIVDVRLRVHDSRRNPEEFIRFVGPPVRLGQADQDEVLRQNEELKAEVANLRTELQARDAKTRRRGKPAARR